MTTERELLELAARAIGKTLDYCTVTDSKCQIVDQFIASWNPATSQADSANLRDALDAAQAKCERLEGALKYVDPSDWAYVLDLLERSIRHPSDAQTKFWIAALKSIRAALNQGADQ